MKTFNLRLPSSSLSSSSSQRDLQQTNNDLPDQKFVLQATLDTDSFANSSATTAYDSSMMMMAIATTLTIGLVGTMIGM